MELAFENGRLESYEMFKDGNRKGWSSIQTYYYAHGIDSENAILSPSNVWHAGTAFSIVLVDCLYTVDRIFPLAESFVGSVNVYRPSKLEQVLYLR